jgi:hypothetical protein
MGRKENIASAFPADAIFLDGEFHVKQFFHQVSMECCDLTGWRVIKHNK